MTPKTTPATTGAALIAGAVALNKQAVDSRDTPGHLERNPDAAWPIWDIAERLERERMEREKAA